MNAADLYYRVAFDAPTEEPDGTGGVEVGWDTENAVETRARFIYHRGDEAVSAARLQGRSIYKLKVRSSAAMRAVTTNWRMRDLRLTQAYNVREIDPLTDRRWVYLVVEQDPDMSIQLPVPRGPAFDSGFSIGFS